MFLQYSSPLPGGPTQKLPDLSTIRPEIDTVSLLLHSTDQSKSQARPDSGSRKQIPPINRKNKMIKAYVEGRTVGTISKTS